MAPAPLLDMRPPLPPATAFFLLVGVCRSAVLILIRHCLLNDARWTLRLSKHNHSPKAFSTERTAGFNSYDPPSCGFYRSALQFALQQATAFRNLRRFAPRAVITSMFVCVYEVFVIDWLRRAYSRRHYHRSAFKWLYRSTNTLCRSALSQGDTTRK